MNPTVTPRTPAFEIRRLRRGESEVVVELLSALSPRSRYLRFLSPLPRLPQSLVDRLSAVDDRDHVALVAFVADRAIAEARYSRAPGDPTRADFAIAVVDEYQGNGVARALSAVLAAHACDAGVTAFTFDVSPENRPMLVFLHRRGARSRLVDGVITGEVDVTSFLAQPCGTCEAGQAA